MTDPRPTPPPASATSDPTVRLEQPAAPVGSAPPALAGRYEILGEIGAGGMGKVYRARDRETNEVVALKVLRPDVAAAPGMAERFKNELRLARRITHKNVCRIYEFHRADDIAYITMEYVEGESLRARLRHAAPLAVASAVELIVQICAGLREAHAQGVIHRDLKPENIMIASPKVVKIMDFGIARSMENQATTTQSFLGTPAYMAPEQAHGKPVDQRADVYALGLIFYECVTGRRTFSGDTPLEVALKQVNERPVAPRRIVAKIPAHIEAIILRCLEKDPGRRFASVDQVEAALTGNVATPVTVDPRPLPARRGRTAAWLGAVLILALLVVWQKMKAPVATVQPASPPTIENPRRGTLPAVSASPSEPQVNVDRPVENADASGAPAKEQGSRPAYERLVAAAEGGRADAQYRLAQFLALGPHATRDESRGAHWMQRAADQGHAEAQFALGKMYEKGRGVERNPATARMWYERAAAGGHEAARQLLKRSLRRGAGR